MKKGLKVVIISCLAMSLLAGCGGKKPSASRVESVNFTFTSEEFKTDFNDAVGFDTCEPNVDTKKFEEFLDNNLTNATILKDASEEIGDLKVSLNTKTSIEFEFEPNGEK